MRMLRLALIFFTLGFPGMSQSIAQTDTIKVTLLGTGTPQLNPRRMSYS